ncbi:hypothetical protein BSKO_04483 [Bryopsis sp. KO-2023]|nr:hypothetical protein BSKO_04483 [Bryopsis sp. KO-2023]
MEPHVTYLEPEQVALLLQNPVDKEKTLIVDVRDDDFSVGGHIRDCVNLPVDCFEDDDEVDQIVKTMCPKFDRIIFHCMMSQRRGPFCAKRMARRLELSDLATKPDVHILSYGFKRFRALHPELCEDS